MRRCTSNVKNKLELYEDFLKSKAIQKLFKGTTDTSRSLSDIPAITTTPDSYLSEDYTNFNPAKATSDWFSKASGTHPGSSINFSDLGNSYQIYDFLGLGFNSTCCTCNNHYSVIFTFDNAEKYTTTIDPVTNQTVQNYGYKMAVDGSNYTLEIDIKTLMQKGISNGIDFADALIEIFDQATTAGGIAFDGHFTQYATNNDGKIYIIDNRTTSQVTRTNGTFDTEPYDLNQLKFPINLVEVGGSREIDLEYSVDFGDLLDPHAAAVEDNDGDYVKENGLLKLYNPDDYQNQPTPQRYKIEISNEKTDAFWNSYYDTLMKSIVDSTTLDLNATDYDYFSYGTDEENPTSTAIADFDTRTLPHRNFWIQSGANSEQGINMNWDTFSTYKLGLQFKDIATRETAQETLAMIDKSMAQISALRTTFGTYTNRFNHTVNYNENASENMQSSESKIRDMDMAKGMMEMARTEILSQAGMSLLAQTNNMTQGVLQLLQ